MVKRGITCTSKVKPVQNETREFSRVGNIISREFSVFEAEKKTKKNLSLCGDPLFAGKIGDVCMQAKKTSMF